MKYLAHMYGMGEGQYGMWGDMGINMFLWGLLWAIFIATLIYGVVRLTQTETSQKQGDSSVGIVKERYAKGEISKKEYEQITKDLKD